MTNTRSQWITEGQHSIETLNVTFIFHPSEKKARYVLEDLNTFLLFKFLDPRIILYRERINFYGRESKSVYTFFTSGYMETWGVISYTSLKLRERFIYLRINKVKTLPWQENHKIFVAFSFGNFVRQKFHCFIIKRGNEITPEQFSYCVLIPGNLCCHFIY